MKFTKAMLAAALVTGVTSQFANATLITIESGSAAYLSGVEASFLGSLISGTTESFNGLADATASYVGGEQDQWEATATTFSTAVGDFTLLAAGQAGENTNNGNLMIESRATGEYGREVLASNSQDLWLDSNDAELVSWNILGDEAFNAIGFYLADPNDQGANLNLSYSDGTSEQIDLSFGSGSLFYVTIISDLTVVGATLEFQNCVSTVNCDDFDPDDGWGIDDATIGVVPEPGSLALLAVGLMGLAAARRKSN